MKTEHEFDIKFSGLKIGIHKFDFQVDKSFFDLFEYSDFENANLNVEVVMEKKSNSLELNFTMNGSVSVPCDITSEIFDLDVQNDISLLVKYGEEFNDENEVVLIIPYDSHEVNVGQYIYEMAVLGVPLRRIHQEVVSGHKGQEALKKLQELSPEGLNENEEKEIDPRWDKLRTLLN